MCNSTISIQADRVESKEGNTEYYGDVIVSSGSLIIKVNALTISEENNAKLTLLLGEAKFIIEYPNRIVEGESDYSVFNNQECVLDLFGDAYLNSNGDSLKTSNVRYLLNFDEVKPLSLFIDHGIPDFPILVEIAE